MSMPTTQNNNIKFVDFCAGIGGGRIGLENLGMRCVGFSEITPSYIRTYREFFGNDETNYGNLMKIDSKDLPNFDRYKPANIDFSLSVSFFILKVYFH